MRKIKIWIPVFLLFFVVSCMQDTTEKMMLTVDEPEDIITLQRGYYKGQFSPDGNQMLFTDQSNNGLSMYDIGANKLTRYTSAMDAGLEASYSYDGNKIYYLTHQFEDKIRKSSLYVLDVNKGSRDILVDKVRNLKLVYGDKKSILFYENSNPREYDLQSGQFLDEVKDQVGVFSDVDLNLGLYRNGKSVNINPVGAGNYLWPSLSPDMTKVLFTVSGKGTYISDLEGKNVVSLGRLHAPKWSADGKYVIGMDDQDDGQKFTSSDVILVSADGKYRQNLTKQTDVIALYPELSPDGKKILFNDENGRVYLMNVL
jgi:Tol biopolymer transport system component